MYAWIFDWPSDRTTKFALPKLRIARIRPAVLVSTAASSRSAFVFAPCAATSASIVSVRLKRRGYGSTPSRTSSLKFSRRCRRRSDSSASAILNGREARSLPVQPFPDRVDDPVDEGHRFIAAVGPCELDRFVDDD